MASKSIGSIYAELTLKDKMTSGLKKAQASLGKFSMASAKWAGLGLATGVTAASAALLAGSKHTLSMTDELADMSAQTGVAIADMMKLQRAYADGGREADNVGKDFAKMQKALVGATTGGADPFAALGLSAQELINKDPAKAFYEIGNAIMRIENPAMRTAKAMEIFGKGGMGLTTVFGGLEGAERALGRMPELAQKFGAAMGEANDLIGHLPVKSDQFFMGFTAGIIGELLPNLRRIDEYDFTTIGQNLGQALATGFQMITDGTLFELMELRFYAVFTEIEIGLQDLFGEISQSSIDALNDLQGGINRINDEINAKFKQRSDAAAAVGNKPPIESPIDPYVAPAADPWTYKSTTSSADNMVNDYQRRGLSLDSSPAAATAGEQVKYLAKVAALMERMVGQMNILTNPT